jgi:hypothetical protein
MANRTAESEHHPTLGSICLDKLARWNTTSRLGDLLEDVLNVQNPICVPFRTTRYLMRSGLMTLQTIDAH